MCVCVCACACVCVCMCETERERESGEETKYAGQHIQVCTLQCDRFQYHMILEAIRDGVGLSQGQRLQCVTHSSAFHAFPFMAGDSTTTAGDYRTMHNSAMIRQW